MNYNLPVPLVTLEELFEWLEDKPCDTTLHHTMTFIHERKMPMEQGLDLRCWLQAHSGHCDCEILMNIAHMPERWRGHIAEPPPGAA